MTGIGSTIVFLVVRHVLRLVGLGPKPDDKDVEIAVLRHQGAILHRQVARSPTSTAAMRGQDSVQIYDYADTRVPVLKRMFEKRMKTYRALGFLDKESGRA